MPLLIDAYNVLHTTGVLPAEHAGIDVDDLVALIGVSRYRRHRCTLVCDGAGIGQHRPTAAGEIHIVYSGPSRTADDVILDMIAADSAPRQLTVVTSDMAILKAARRRRCPLLRSPAFLAQLAHDVDQPLPKRSPGRRIVDALPRDEVRKWVHHFELSADELALLAADAEQFVLEPDDEPADPIDEALPAEAPTAESTDAPSAMLDLPAELIEQAQRMLEQASAPPTGRAVETDDDAPDDTTDHQPPAPPRSPTQRRDVQQASLDDLSDDDVDAIDLAQWLPGVQPLNEDNDDDDAT